MKTRTCGCPDHAAHLRRWRRSNPEKTSEYRQRYREENPEKVRAHRAVYKAIKRGALVRPDTCERCGRPGAVEASHDDYDRVLDVEWLCRPCHRIKDGFSRSVR